MNSQFRAGQGSNSTDSVLELVAAMMRAKESGNTDEETRQSEVASEICRAIWTACEKAHVISGGPLDTNLCLRAVAICLGMLIKQHRKGKEDQLAGLIVATKMCELVLSVATEK